MNQREESADSERAILAFLHVAPNFLPLTTLTTARALATLSAVANLVFYANRK